MLKRAVVVMLLAFTIGSAPIAAQGVSFVVSGFGGYSGNEGIKGKGFLAANGETYDTLTPGNGGHYGFTFGVTEGHGEYGFMFRRQMSSLTASGTATTLIGDMPITSYHGYLAYYFGDPDNRFHPYVSAGVGATNFGRVDFTMATGGDASIAGRTEFSATFGAGLRTWFNRSFGMRFGVQWTPIYLTEKPDAVWCDDNSCHAWGYPQYSNQVEASIGVLFRFGGS